MAKGRKTGGKDWKQGQSGNPSGRPQDPPQVKQFKRLTQEIVEEIAFLVLDGDENAIFKIVHDPESSVLKKWLASVALNGIQIGDMDPLEKLLNRLIGKPKERIEHSGTLTLEDLVAGSQEKE